MQDSWDSSVWMERVTEDRGRATGDCSVTDEEKGGCVCLLLLDSSCSGNQVVVHTALLVNSP
jgi:hypothetical protein